MPANKQEALDYLVKHLKKWPATLGIIRRLPTPDGWYWMRPNFIGDVDLRQDSADGESVVYCLRKSDWIDARFSRSMVEERVYTAGQELADRMDPTLPLPVDLSQDYSAVCIDSDEKHVFMPPCKPPKDARKEEINELAKALFIASVYSARESFHEAEEFIKEREKRNGDS